MKPEPDTKYFVNTIIKHYLFRKGRRKDKDSPTPPNAEEQKEYLEDPYFRDRISDADFFKLVALPNMLDLNEWLATHTISFFNHVNLIYGVVSEYCTVDTCPAMTAPDNVQYFWYDEKGKKSKNTAPQYIDYVMTHIQKLINDENVFPTKFGHPFPPDLVDVVKRIHKYLFHVLAHIYHAHYKLLRQLGLHGHLNSLFTHFMVFASKFDLVQDKESDILLQLFSLLLKNLADPNQNPKVREGLGIGEGMIGPPYDSKSKKTDGSVSPVDEGKSSQHSQRLSNGGSNLRPTHCDTDISADQKDSKTEQGDSKKSSPTTSQPQRSPHKGLGEGMDSGASELPSEWLSNLQVSAT
ncbi:MOB kinase activator 2-like isoform X3 [Biomphalaria glabrata]|uniref:MOB kinase activator 2-like isoform X3 n=1 Tax=Biomphalaria glabrata TaxID=6526 RepID=A0A2C9K0L8_BIOGL|nr:MOB kinase activator 2-like isoform X3 [Biomphalaria glabrata]